MMHKILVLLSKVSIIIFVCCLSISNVFAITLDNQKIEFNDINDDVYKQLMQQKVQGQKNDGIPLYIDDQVLVKFKVDDVDLSENTGILKKMKLDIFKGIDVHKELIGVNIIVYDIQDGETVEKKIQELENDSNIEYAQPNYIYRLLDVTTNDADFGKLWATENTGQTLGSVTGTDDADMDIVEAWSIEDGTSNSVTVAVIDSGVSYNHPDLTSNMWNGSSCVDSNGDSVPGGCVHGYDTFDDDNNPEPDNVAGSMHGTHVAGIIAAADNSIGVIGVNPHTKIMAVKSAGYVPGFGVVSSSESVIEAINFARHNNADIINISLGNGVYDTAMKTAINAFPGPVVVAAGNDGNSMPMYPASYQSSNIISVAATDQNDELASFSNYGETSIDVGAPGVNIYSTTNYKTGFSENLQSITPPDIPTGFDNVNTSFGTYDAGSSNNVFIGDTTTSPYNDDNIAAVKSPTIDLSEYLGWAYFDFWVYCDTEYTSEASDYMLLGFSNDDGVTWVDAYIDVDGDGAGDGAIPFDEHTLGILNNADENPNGGYAFNFSDVYPIPSELMTNEFKFSFFWITNSTDHDYAGCYVDNIVVRGANGKNGDGYVYSQGTSMATAQVAGLTALLLSYEPSLSTAEIKSIILDTGDDLATLDEKTVTGKRVNAQKALESLAPTMDHFIVTGSNTQQAGDHREITIKAIDSRSDIHEDYDGDYNITFSGAGSAPDGTVATCMDKDNAHIDFGTATTITFVDGVATCDMTLYKKEDVSISVSKDEYNADNEVYDLDVSVSAADVSPEDTFISVSPDPAYIGGEAVITVTAKDQYRNSLAGGGDSVGLLIFNGTSEVPVDTDDQSDGTYTETHVLTDPVDIIVRGTINSSEIGSDGDGDDNGTYNLTVIPPVLDHLAISGSNTQQAGASSVITITAINSIGNTHTDYTGDQIITLSGANNAPDDTEPTCTDKDNNDVKFGTTTNITFTDGVATCDIKLYKKEPAEIDGTDGTYDTTGTTEYDLNVDVSVGDPSYKKSVLSVSPDPTHVEKNTMIVVTVKDDFENILDRGGDVIVVGVAGSNENIPAVTDKGDGTYKATYIPGVVGNDLIIAKLNGTIVSIDTDGVVDGRYELEVLKKDDDGSDEGDDIKKDEIEVEKPSMSLSGKVKKTLSKKKKIYVSQDKIKFKGKIPELAGGKVVVKSKRGSKSEKDETTIKSDGSWKEKVKFDKDGTWQVKFTFYDKHNNKVDSVGTYKIKIDTVDPEFTNLPDTLNKSKGDTIWFEAKDDERFKKFKVYFDGKIESISVKGKKDVVVRGDYKLPVDIAPGSYLLKVKAYDKAGNVVKKEVQIHVQ